MRVLRYQVLRPLLAVTALAAAFTFALASNASSANDQQHADVGQKLTRIPMKLLVLDDRSRITPMTEDSCQWGYFHCPDVGGDDFIYANLSTCVAFCGADGTKSQVLTLCNNNCVAACVPGGEWFAC